MYWRQSNPRTAPTRRARASGSDAATRSAISAHPLDRVMELLLGLDLAATELEVDPAQARPRLEPAHLEQELGPLRDVALLPLHRLLELAADDLVDHLLHRQLRGV